MGLDTLTSLFAGTRGVALTVMAVRANSLIDEKVSKGELSPAQAIKWRKFFRPACLIFALCGFAAAALSLFHK